MASELDIEQPAALADYLRRTGRAAPGEPIRSRVLTGGVSNKTVLVEFSGRPEAWVLKQALGKLRVAVDWFSDPARIRREALGIVHLAALAPPGSITPLIFEDVEHHLLAMRAVPEPHENWKTMLLRGDLQTPHVEQFASLIGEIHRRSAKSDAKLEQIFDDRSFFESLRLEPYYAYTASRVPAAAKFLRELIDATRQTRRALVHGDYSPKNILIHAGKMTLLDHEVIHWGDPAFDAGFALAHLLSKAHHLESRRRDFAQAAVLFWRVYAKSSELGELERSAAKHAMACLLARVAGRSPLEYLSDAGRLRQRETATKLMQQPPLTMEELTASFIKGIEENA